MITGRYFSAPYLRDTAETKLGILKKTKLMTGPPVSCAPYKIQQLRGGHYPQCSFILGCSALETLSLNQITPVLKNPCKAT